ncbi:hypothetical protein M2451_003626 [Dysgonomonas sp. PFB1-18]|nr:hypothetical protein [Dysgonomonas sp. PF1-14]MDH6340608.1 hypothetical protein [Dysgonomonas sp. PF1-16]MDH6382285.1 hypothetical protein [Dysgonomonas sp. PFB1-18]MDH6399578.1 hypothetical protein [Dysgonomonas sp. PF1-23]
MEGKATTLVEAVMAKAFASIPLSSPLKSGGN